MKELKYLLRVQPENKRKWEKAARDKGVSLNKYINDATNFYNELPIDFLKQLEKQSESLKIHVSSIVVNKLIKQVAQEHAYLSVFAENHPKAFNEFHFDEDGLISGDRLVEKLTAEYLRYYEGLQEIQEKLKSTKKKKSITLSREAVTQLQAGL